MSPLAAWNCQKAPATSNDLLLPAARWTSAMGAKPTPCGRKRSGCFGPLPGKADA